MQSIAHMWNLVTHLSEKFVAENGLQNYYVGCCWDLKQEIELPKNIFGPTKMCQSCGSLWSQVAHKVRVWRGRRPGRSVEKLMTRNTDKKLNSKVKQTLFRKSEMNKANKLVITCSYCHKDTMIKMTKPARLKPTQKQDDAATVSTTVKKRKKRTKDKSAGLTITKANDKNPMVSKTPKIKQTNLGKLGVMVVKNITPSKNSPLHNFIAGLS